MPLAAMSESSIGEGEAARWLASAARPGSRDVTVATGLRVAATVASCLQWGAVAVLAEDLIDGGGYWLLAPSLAVACLAGSVAAGLTWGAGAASRRASAAMATSLRRRIVERALPDRAPRRGESPAVVAEGGLELVDQVSDHLAGSAPLQRSAGISMALIMVATVVAHWPSGIVLALATAMIPANMWLAGMLAKDGNDRYLHSLERLSAIVLDSFRGIATLQRLGVVETRRQVIGRASRRLQRANMAVLRRAFVSGAVMDVVVTLSIAVAATYIGMTLLGYVQVPGAGHLDLAHGLFVLLLCPMYFTPMRQAAAGFHDRERAAANARVLADLAGDPSASNPSDGDVAGTTARTRHRWAGEDGDVRSEAGARTVSRPVDRPVTVVAENVRLDAPDTGREIVRVDGSLRAPAGLWTAIVGESGAGKTTLLEALSGLRIPDAGRVTWAGLESATIGEPDARPRAAPASGSAPVLGGAAWIGQSTVLIEGTLADNLRIGAPDANEAQLVDALGQVGLAALLAGLPRGLDTPCGSGGYAFSAGEARRIAIARSLLRGSRLWMLDEPTAHLDADSEERVVAALRRATEGCTVLVVTHSAAVAVSASIVWEVSDGRVRVRQGSAEAIPAAEVVSGSVGSTSSAGAAASSPSTTSGGVR